MIRERIHKALKKRRNQLRKHRAKRLPQLEQLERRDLLAVTIDGMQLVNDTGLSDTDRVTSDPSVTATVNGVFSGGYVQVEFDHYADGYVEGNSTVNMPGEQFNYDPRMVDESLNYHEGLLTLRYRGVQYDSQSNVVETGNWTDFVLTLQQPVDPEIDVVDSWSVSIADGVGSANFGSTNAGVPVSMTFSIYNWGIDPLTIDTASFSVPSGYTLTAPPAGSVDSNGGETSFTLQLDGATPGSYSGTVSFANDDQDENPYDFTVTGEVLGQGAEIEVLVTGGAVVPDGSGSVDLGNTNLNQAKSQSFTIKNWGSSELTIDTSSISVPAGYSIVTTPAATVSGGGGETTLVIQLDATSAGTYSGTVAFANSDSDESPYDFSVTGAVLEGGEELGIVNFGLVTDTGNDASDRVTFDPRVSGKVNGDFEGGTVHVQFDHDGDTTAEGSVIVRHGGDSFQYDPRDADASLDGYTGSLSLSYRMVHLDADGNNISTGSWISYSITLEAKPEASGAVLDSIGLYRDTGSSSVDRITVQPVLASVVGGDIGTGYVRVEFDHDANGSVDGFVETTESGSSLIYTPPGQK